MIKTILKMFKVLPDSNHESTDTTFREKPEYIQKAAKLKTTPSTLEADLAKTLKKKAHKFEDTNDIIITSKGSYYTNNRESFSWKKFFGFDDENSSRS